MAALPLPVNTTSSANGARSASTDGADLDQSDPCLYRPVRARHAKAVLRGEEPRELWLRPAVSVDLAADVAGYSWLTGADEEGTLERLNALRHRLVDSKIADHRGRIVKSTGDALLVEFASVVDAVRCATEIQRMMVDRDTNLSENRRIKWRIGIDLGDIIADGDDIFGAG